MAGWMKLGKTPARAGAVKMQFRTAFSAVRLPTPPTLLGRPWLVPQWGMLGNDKVGNCVWAGGAHEEMMWSAIGGRSLPSFTDASVLASYSDATGYDPSKPGTDRGTDVQKAASYRLHTGILDAAGQHRKIDAYANIEAGNTGEVATACMLFGAVGIGLQLPSSAMDQFDLAEPWTDDQGSDIAGGHYVTIVGRNSRGLWLLVTWGRLHSCTSSFLSTYMDEGIAYLNFRAVRVVSPEVETNLRAELAELTGTPTEENSTMATTPTKPAAPVSGTTPGQAAAEYTALIALYHKFLNANIPGWEQMLIPNLESKLQELAIDSVHAVDDARATATE